MGLYDRYLALRIRSHEGTPPATVALAITERDLLEKGAYDTLEAFFGWAFDYGSEQLIVSVSVLDSAVIPTLKRELNDLDAPAPMAIREPNQTEQAAEPIIISIGLGGKNEFARAVRSLAHAVDAGTISPDDIDASLIENELVFPEEPDLFIKTGAERLSDFMIWQSVYTELYFTDINWRDFRKRDYLRAVLDYMRRQRRFGR